MLPASVFLSRGDQSPSSQNVVHQLQIWGKNHRQLENLFQVPFVVAPAANSAALHTARNTSPIICLHRLLMDSDF